MSSEGQLGEPAVICIEGRLRSTWIAMLCAKGSAGRRIAAVRRFPDSGLLPPTSNT